MVNITHLLQLDTGKESESFIEAMVNLRERILQCWKEMRRALRMIDIRKEGCVSPGAFRQVNHFECNNGVPVKVRIVRGSH